MKSYERRIAAVERQLFGPAPSLRIIVMRQRLDGPTEAEHVMLPARGSEYTRQPGEPERDFLIRAGCAPV